MWWSSGTTIRLVALLGAAVGDARAQDPDSPTLDVQRFDPIAQRPGFSVVRDAAALPPGTLVTMVSSSYALDPFELADGPAVVDHLVGFDLGLGMAPVPWLQFAIDVPLVQVVAGDDLAHDVARSIGSDSDGVGIGDLRLTMGLHLLRQGRNGRFDLAVVPWFGLPSGTRDLLLGSGAIQIGADLALGGRWRHFRFTATVGYVYLTDTEPVADVLADDEARFGVGLAVPLGPRESFEVEAEVVGGAVVIADRLHDLGLRPGLSRETPVELLVGAAYVPPVKPWFGKLGFGVGLTDGFGAPDFRVFLQLGLVLRVLKTGPGDLDDDHVPDVADACVEIPEDQDGHQDADGCPEPDDDLDQVLDVHDACPEDAAAPGDDDGCPDPCDPPAFVVDEALRRNAASAVPRCEEDLGSYPP